ncbi:aldehyde dehydrogenase family protein [Halorientalis sp.]|uniref:aldehyde dehydrogenase family protein n=1 Tax=Halorientalis sp. TaxID=1931229 RepID=UPI0026173A8A|nr:aldehyde dehydrogenase family protein [Halorientalis sp.]
MSPSCVPEHAREGSEALFINGEFVDSESDESIDVQNPANRETIATVPDGLGEDTNRAVASAVNAYEQVWSQTTARERAELLHKVGDRIEEQFESLAELETLENGKPIDQSRSDVTETIKTYRYYGGAADKLHGDTIPEKNGLFDYTVREPYGVVGSIIPWNWPPMHTADFTAPPLAAGNTVIIKPAPEAPLSSLKIAEIWQDTLPDGVVNVVTGGAEPGASLVEHPDVKKIGFTGHTDTGTKILRSAATDITDVMLELGGKNPSIVLPDANIEDAVAGTMDGLLTNTGQACAGCERLLLHESVRDEFIQEFVERVDALSIGPGIDPDMDLGPLANAEQYDKVQNYIDIGKSEGAEVIYEGTVPDGLGDGYYMPPIVFGDVTSDMRICTEEVFGPVLSVTTFDSVERAVELANNTDYGLSAAVWTDQMQVANRLAKRIEAGIVCINNYNNGTFLGAPFGGYNKSGNGNKLSFKETMNEFTRVKTIRTAIAGEEQGDIDSHFES